MKNEFLLKDGILIRTVFSIQGPIGGFCHQTWRILSWDLTVLFSSIGGTIESGCIAPIALPIYDRDTNMASSSTQPTAASQNTDALLALAQHSIADKEAWTQVRRTHKRTLASRRAHAECKRRRHVVTGDTHWADQSHQLNDLKPQTQRVPTSPTQCCPAHQTQPATNAQMAVTNQTTSDRHLHRAAALDKIKCTLKLIAREDPVDARRESARVLLEMMSDAPNLSPSRTNLDSDSEVSRMHDSDLVSNGHSIPTTYGSTGLDAEQAILQQKPDLVTLSHVQ